MATRNRINLIQIDYSAEKVSSCLTCTRMTDSRPSVRTRSCYRCAILDEWVNGWWCDVILSSIHFISTFHHIIQTCLLWLAERRMNVDCYQHSSCHCIMPPSLATAFAIVGLRHAMWCPRTAAVRPLATGTHGKARQGVATGRQTSVESRQAA